MPLPYPYFYVNIFNLFSLCALFIIFAQNMKIMKKLFTLIAVAAVAAIVLPSCKKDWTCECTDSSGDVTSWEIQNSRKPEAKLACEGFISVGTECKLK